MAPSSRFAATRALWFWAAFLAAPLHATSVAPRAEIDARTLSAITRELASDRFEGRAPGTEGETRTIAYLVDRLRALGLEPGGPGGRWTQPVPLLRTRVDRTVPLSLHQDGMTSELVQGSDVYISTQRDVDRVSVTSAPLVFVGYGVNAPEKGWDDFKGVDLKGKIAVFLVNDPDFTATGQDAVAGRFGGKAMTYYGRWSYKFEEAARRGAIGALIVHQTEAAGYGWNTVIAPQGENFDLAQGGAANDRLMMQGWLSGAAARRLFKLAGLDLDALIVAARQPAFHPVALDGLTLDANVPVDRDHVQSQNVIARITGKTRPAETVSFGAHWDAYGIGEAPDQNGSRIRPGALDDGVGVAGILEIARLFKSGPRPDRTVVFGIWTAEERGLLGSEAFARSGLYPASRMVANLTLDTLQPNGPARDIVLIGQGQNSLEDDLRALAAAQGRTVTPDAKPERGLFYRADHFSFVKRGVPSLLFMALGGGVDLVRGGRAAGEAWVSDFTARCYHQTCDAWNPEWDFSGAAQDESLAYEVGRKYAFGRKAPVWKDGSEFKSLRP